MHFAEITGGQILLFVFMTMYFILGVRTKFFSSKLGAVGNPSFDALLSTTIANYRDTFADDLSKSYFLLYWLTTQGRQIEEDGGESIVVPLMYGKNQTVKSYDGYEVLDTSPQEGLTAAKYPWKQVAGSIAISRKEERQNSGEQRIINLLDSKVQQAQISMRDSLNAMCFADGTGNSSKDIFGLQLLVENGSAWGSLGGIDRNDALNDWWRNQWLGAVGSFASNGLTKMRSLYNLCSRGNEHPDFGVTTRAVFEAFEATQVQNQRFVDSRVADANFELLKFKGMIIGYDEQCTSVAADPLYMLNSSYLAFVVDKETNLITTDFVRPENQDAKVCQILLMANMVASNCARQGVMDGITTP